MRRTFAVWSSRDLRDDEAPQVAQAVAPFGSLHPMVGTEWLGERSRNGGIDDPLRGRGRLWSASTSSVPTLMRSSERATTIVCLNERAEPTLS
jgi:hypothetical protein